MITVEQTGMETNILLSVGLKVMERLREPHVEFLNLPVGSYEFSVRCRSTSNKLWSAWSESIIVTINGRALSGTLSHTHLRMYQPICHDSKCLSVSQIGCWP